LADFDGELLDGLEFCSKVYALYRSIRDAPGGVRRMRMRPSALEKKLLEELLPICMYIQSSYRPGRYMSVRWLKGTGYDMEVRQVGAYVGPNQYPETAYISDGCDAQTVLEQTHPEQQEVSFGVEG
jgi:hypothetical protein